VASGAFGSTSLTIGGIGVQSPATQQDLNNGPEFSTTDPSRTSWQSSRPLLPRHEAHGEQTFRLFLPPPVERQVNAAEAYD
jgi:hypothetical protein